MVFEKIKIILSDYLEIEEEKITMDSDVADDLGADSLDVVDIASAIGDEFDIDIPDDQIDSIKTVGDLVKFVESVISN